MPFIQLEADIHPSPKDTESTFDLKMAHGSSGEQHFFIDFNRVPVSEPIVKYDSIEQIQGTTEYTQTMIPSSTFNEYGVHASFVLSQFTTGKFSWTMSGSKNIENILLPYLLKFATENECARLNLKELHFFIAEDINGSSDKRPNLIQARKSDGKIAAMKVEYFSDAGITYDCSLPVMDLSILSDDNTYQIHSFIAAGGSYYTSKVTSTAFRSFGVLQSIDHGESYRASG